MNFSVPIGLVLDDVQAECSTLGGAQPWWLYSTEVLDHLRLPYDVVRPATAAELERVGILVFPSPLRLSAAETTALRQWLESGGVAVCGGVGALAGLVGVAVADDVTEGQVAVEPGNGWIDPPDVPLRALGGVRLDLASAAPGTSVLARWADDGAPAAVAAPHGAGAVVVFGADLWQSVVRIQQGDPVHVDGVPALDGSAAVDDGVLKCDDGIVLSYEKDRALPSEQWRPRPENRAGLEPVPVFHRPHADLWRQSFLQVLFTAADRRGVVLAWLNYWPSGIPAVAHLSVDSDRNVTEEAETTLELFASADVHVTWCHVYPGGYDPDVVRKIGDQGHEHALHYNAVGDADIASWGWPQIRAQHAWAQAMTGNEEIVSNKNHYTRWEGWDEFYLWCDALGIRIDESRGPSKRGNVGFPFGTAHLSFPLTGPADHGNRADVLMLPLHAQDLAWAAHESARDVILEQALAHHGVAHFLFHPVHLHRKAYVRDACRDLVATARDRGMPWWTAERLNAWERLRRGVSVCVRHAGDDELVIVARAKRTVPDAAILLVLPEAWPDTPVTAVTGSGDPVGTRVVERHGRRMLELSVGVDAGETAVTVARGRVAVAAAGRSAMGGGGA